MAVHDKAKIAFVEKYTPIPWFLAILGVHVLEKLLQQVC